MRKAFEDDNLTNGSERNGLLAPDGRAARFLVTKLFQSPLLEEPSAGSSGEPPCISEKICSSSAARQ